jgi:vanillate O-demethylase monooxygenase subunit
VSRLSFWHPILPAAQLRAGDVTGVRIAGQGIALFRDKRGQLGAIADRCAHRKMKLSTGHVAQGRIVCPYHGWSYDADGRAHSPANPRFHACVAAFAIREAVGAIWLRAGDGAPPPLIEEPEGGFVVVRNRVAAPIELVIDNFSEVEHTIAMHPQFGFDATRIGEARVEIATTPDSVTVRNSGPAKPLPFAMRIAVALRRRDLFHSDYTLRFDPPRSMVTHRWSDPESGAERRLAYHLIHYFVPEDDAATTILTFGALSLRWPFARAVRRPATALFRRKIVSTIEEDAALLANLADKAVSLDDMRLGRFDAVLPLTRERLYRIYGS